MGFYTGENTEIITSGFWRNAQVLMGDKRMCDW